MLNKKLKNALKLGNIGFITDVDGTLTPPGNHKQLLRYQDTLIRLQDATYGALMFLTNNDGRSLDAVAKKVRRTLFTAIGVADAYASFNNATSNETSDFHPIIVSEHATRIREWAIVDGKFQQITRNADNIPSMDIDGMSKLLPPSEKIKLSDGRPRYQPKENTICFNFPAGDEAESNRLEALAINLIRQHNLVGFEVVTLLDSVEITPINAHKKDILKTLDQFDKFKNTDYIIMVGDTETDADVARELHAQGRGGMIAVGNNVQDGDYILQRVETVEELMELLDVISPEIEANKINAFHRKCKIA